MCLYLFLVSIFDLEEDIDRSSPKEATLPLLELSQAPRQKSHQRSRSSGGSGSALPQSLSSLRPTSLPSPSISRLVTPSEPSVTSPKEESVPGSVTPEPELTNHHLPPDEDDVMMKLVAAHTPSHRGLWDKDDGKALRMIMGEGDTRHLSASKSPIDSETASIDEELGRFICETPLRDSR
jgi:hypothetical protein